MKTIHDFLRVAGTSGNDIVNYALCALLLALLIALFVKNGRDIKQVTVAAISGTVVVFVVILLFMHTTPVPEVGAKSYEMLKKGDIGGYFFGYSDYSKAAVEKLHMFYKNFNIDGSFFASKNAERIWKSGGESIGIIYKTLPHGWYMNSVANTIIIIVGVAFGAAAGTFAGFFGYLAAFLARPAAAAYVGGSEILLNCVLGALFGFISGAFFYKRVAANSRSIGVLIIIYFAILYWFAMVQSSIKDLVFLIQSLVQKNADIIVFRAVISIVFRVLDFVCATFLSIILNIIPFIALWIPQLWIAIIFSMFLYVLLIPFVMKLRNKNIYRTQNLVPLSAGILKITTNVVNLGADLVKGLNVTFTVLAGVAYVMFVSLKVIAPPNIPVQTRFIWAIEALVVISGVAMLFKTFIQWMLKGHHQSNL